MMRRDLEVARAEWIKQAPTDVEKDAREKSDFCRDLASTGKIVDFHSLRHTFASNLAKAGVTPKAAQELLRHSTIALTLDRYTHVGLYDLGSALSSLPGLEVKTVTAEPQTRILRATGTSNATMVDESLVARMVARVVANREERLKTIEHNCHSVNCTEETPQPPHLAGVASDCEPLAANEKMHQEGVEPPTYGSEDRCSIH